MQSCAAIRHMRSKATEHSERLHAGEPTFLPTRLAVCPRGPRDAAYRGASKPQECAASMAAPIACPPLLALVGKSCTNTCLFVVAVTSCTRNGNGILPGMPSTSTPGTSCIHPVEATNRRPNRLPSSGCRLVAVPLTLRGQSGRAGQPAYGIALFSRLFGRCGRDWTRWTCLEHP